MSLKLFAHPFSSYCQKVLISLYENELDFDYCMLEGEEAAAELERLWPLGKFPVLVDEGQVIAESSIIVEYLGLHHPGPVKLVPEDPRQALEVRFMDRYFDNYIMTPMQAIVADAIRPPESRDPFGVADVQRTLDKAYQWLNDKMADRRWAAGNEFTLADCAAAPSLFYADWVQPFGEELAALRRYRQQLLERPSFARAVDEARPYRQLFPLGAPDRD